MQKQACRTWRFLRGNTVPEIRAAVSTHVQENLQGYIKYGFHAFYIAFLVVKIRRAMSGYSVWRNVLRKLELLWSHGVGHFLALRWQQIVTQPFFTTLQELRQAFRVALLISVIGQYLFLMLLDVKALYEHLLVLKSRYSSVRILY